MSNDKLLADNMKKIKVTLKNRYPKISQVVDLILHLYKELLIFLAFVIYFTIIIFAQKNLINWGFQFILGIFLIAYLGVGNYAPIYTGLRRLSFVWNSIIYYSAFVLISTIIF